MSHIFISYSKQNKAYTDKLVEYLEKAGFNVWYDGRIDYGSSWQRVIFEAIKNCAVFIVVMSPESYESEWVEREYLYADKLKKPQFPLLLDGEEFPFYVSNQYTDVRGEKLPPDAFLRGLEKYLTRQNRTGKNVVPPEIKSTPAPSKTASRKQRPTTPEQQQLLDLINNPATEPPERLKAGMRLAEIGDPRPGVGLDENGLPDIAWVRIPAGEFLYGSDKKKDPDAYDGETPQRKIHLPEFYIAKYPVTYIQFQAFIDAKDGFYNNRWWQGLAGRDKNPDEQYWKIANHPRENVTWYAAVAFCRWLDAQYKARGLSPLSDPDSGTRGFNPLPGGTITLPTEQQWERAARGSDGRIYPWGNQYISGYANINETSGNVGKYYLEQTTAVGMYPQGASPDGVLDMSGNVWEWCLNEYGSRNSNINTNNTRVRRGGAWSFYSWYARAAYRYGFDPFFRDHYFGFGAATSGFVRLCASPISLNH